MTKEEKFGGEEDGSQEMMPGLSLPGKFLRREDGRVDRAAQAIFNTPKPRG